MGIWIQYQKEMCYSYTSIAKIFVGILPKSYCMYNKCNKPLLLPKNLFNISWGYFSYKLFWKLTQAQYLLIGLGHNTVIGNSGCTYLSTIS